MKDKKKFTKGKANRRSLADRMKAYENVITGASLIERLPIYARVDMRAGHSFCKGLDKPFDSAYSNAMRFATAYVLEHTGAIVASSQSDESSFCWLDDTKIPFGTRLFKLESVIASMFTSAFFKACIGTKLENKLEKMLPSFDCRCCNLPNLSEAANMFCWREQDSKKNSITLLALEHFSTKQLDKKNGIDKIAMLKDIGVDYWKTIPEDLRNGAYFRRETYSKEVSEEDLACNPKMKLPAKSADGKYYVTRSHVVQFYPGMSLDEMSNKEDVLFRHAIAMKKNSNNDNTIQ